MHIMRTIRLLFGSLMLLALTMPVQAQLKLNGAGATFPYVIYSKWFDLYHTKTDIQFNYQSIGSGGGIKQVIDVMGDENLVTATDFAHPEGRRYAWAVKELLELPGVTEESKRKIMWDNARKLYQL